MVCVSYRVWVFRVSTFVLVGAGWVTWGVPALVLDSDGGWISMVLTMTLEVGVVGRCR